MLQHQINIVNFVLVEIKYLGINWQTFVVDFRDRLNFWENFGFIFFSPLILGSQWLSDH